MNEQIRITKRGLEDLLVRLGILKKKYEDNAKNLISAYKNSSDGGAHNNT